LLGLTGLNFLSGVYVDNSGNVSVVPASPTQFGGVVIGKIHLVALPSGPWWIYTGGVIGVIYIAFTSTIVQHLGVLTFTLFSVGGQLVGSLVIDLVSPTEGVHISTYLVSGIVLTYLGVIAGGVSSSRVRKPRMHK
jgi:transporter family-2 protein